MTLEGVEYETFTFEEFPSVTLCVALVKNVKNAKELRQRIMSGSLEPEAAVINATLLPDIFILHLAARVALQASRRAALRSRSLHAELVFSLSGSKHIGESLGKFGVNEDSKHLILARFDATPEEMQRLRELVEGEAAATGEAAVLVDVPLLTKYYKVQKEELEIGSLADAITSRIAARDCM